MTVTIRPAQPADCGLVLTLIRELAEYEKLLDHVRCAQADVERLLFGPAPRAFSEIAELDGQAAGFSLWFYNVSTFAGRAGIYIEDLYVRPAARGAGAGKALVASLARRCLDEDLTRLTWAVLDWNASSIAFYDRLGAESLDDWVTRRLSGEALARLAREG